MKKKDTQREKKGSEKDDLLKDLIKKTEEKNIALHKLLQKIKGDNDKKKCQ